MGTILTAVILPLFGLLSMAMLLNVKLKELSAKRLGLGLLFTILIVLLNLWFLTSFGPNTYRSFYLLLVQLPCFILFSIISRYRGIQIVFVLLTAITFVFLPISITKIIQNLSNCTIQTATLTLAISSLVVLILIYYFVKPDFNYILDYGEKRAFWKYCIIPLLYYLHIFSVTKYDFTKVLTTERLLMTHIPTIMVFVTYFLFINTFRNTREKEVNNAHENLLTIQLTASKQQYEQLKSLHELGSVYQENMNHHFRLIYDFLKDQESDKALEYLHFVQANLIPNAPKPFCQNNSINLILSYYASKATEHDVSFFVNADLPAELSLPTTELCAIFSNALENAISASSKVKNTSLKKVSVSCYSHKGNLLISVQNGYLGEVPMENNLPIQKQTGHGFGVKSIAMLADRYHGYCSFQAKDELFLLKIVLPLGNA